MSSDTTEPLAAILAEMRDKRIIRLDGADVTRCLLRNLADRIEVAYKREHAQWHGETNAAKEARNRIACKMRYEFAAKCRACKAAPGNAAAIREALHECLASVTHLRALFCNTDPMQGPDRAIRVNDLEPIADKIERATAALAAPARNCDRFQTADEAVGAFADHLRAWENAHGIHSEYPDHPVQVPAGAFAWLFAPAEGGDHA